MTDAEKKDMYIAAGVGGVALILILLYIHSAPQAGVAQLPAADTTVPAVADQTPYNYNIAPYGGSGPLNIPQKGPISIAGQGNNSPGSGGCCDQCGTSTGSSYQNPGVAAFLKLLALGA